MLEYIYDNMLTIGHHGLCHTNTMISLNMWTHVAVSVSGSEISLYVDGLPAGGASGVVRTLCYFGQSNWDIDGLFDDVLKINY